MVLALMSLQCLPVMVGVGVGEGVAEAVLVGATAAPPASKAAAAPVARVRTIEFRITVTFSDRL